MTTEWPWALNGQVPVYTKYLPLHETKFSSVSLCQPFQISIEMQHCQKLEMHQITSISTVLEYLTVKSTDIYALMSTYPETHTLVCFTLRRDQPSWDTSMSKLWNLPNDLRLPLKIQWSIVSWPHLMLNPGSQMSLHFALQPHFSKRGCQNRKRTEWTQNYHELLTL